MRELVLFVGNPQDCQAVKTFTEITESKKCICLEACALLCLCDEPSENEILPVENDRLVLARGEDEVELGSHGLVCFSHQSARVINAITSEDVGHECLVINIEGLLDDGLTPNEDFVLREAIPLDSLSGLDRSFLASVNFVKGSYWCFIVQLERNALAQLLNSSTHGYLLGVRITSVNEQVTSRLVRCSGYDDTETDILIFGNSSVSNKAVVETKLANQGLNVIFF